MVNPARGAKAAEAALIKAVTERVNVLAAEKVISEAGAKRIIGVVGVGKEWEGFMEVLDSLKSVRGGVTMTDKAINKACKLIEAGEMVIPAAQYGNIITLIKENKLRIAGVEELLTNPAYYFSEKSHTARALLTANATHTTENYVYYCMNIDHCNAAGKPLPTEAMLPRISEAVVANTAAGARGSLSAAQGAQNGATKGATIGGNGIGDMINASGNVASYSSKTTFYRHTYRNPVTGTQLEGWQVVPTALPEMELAEALVMPNMKVYGPGKVDAMYDIVTKDLLDLTQQILGRTRGLRGSLSIGDMSKLLKNEKYLAAWNTAMKLENVKRGHELTAVCKTGTKEAPEVYVVFKVDDPRVAQELDRLHGLVAP